MDLYYFQTPFQHKKSLGLVFALLKLSTTPRLLHVLDERREKGMALYGAYNIRTQSGLP